MARPADITPESVRQICAREGCPVSADEAACIGAYLQLLMQWNKAMNLVGAHHWRDALEGLVMDSLRLRAFLESDVLPALPAEPAAWDLGAGAGLPGIPLRIVWRRGTYELVESRDKRTIFMSTFLARHPLPGTTVRRARAEDFMAGKKADLVISRAFMPWRDMLAFVGGRLDENGRIVFLLRADCADAPAGWEKTSSASYRCGGDERWFCAFRRTGAAAGA